MSGKQNYANNNVGKLLKK